MIYGAQYREEEENAKDDERVEQSTLLESSKIASTGYTHFSCEEPIDSDESNHRKCGAA